MYCVMLPWKQQGCDILCVMLPWLQICLERSHSELLSSCPGICQALHSCGSCASQGRGVDVTNSPRLHVYNEKCMWCVKEAQCQKQTGNMASSVHLSAWSWQFSNISDIEMKYCQQFTILCNRNTSTRKASNINRPWTFVRILNKARKLKGHCQTLLLKEGIPRFKYNAGCLLWNFSVLCPIY